MKDLKKFDVLLCPSCGMVMAQATADIEAGEMNWTTKLRAVELKQLPAPGTSPEVIACPRCNAAWWPDFIVKG